MMKKKPKTTLKLWEKSFLLTFCVFFILLNIAFGIWSVYQFKSASVSYTHLRAHET